MSSGCRPNFDGDFDGEATITLNPASKGAADPAKKTPVHVHVAGDQFDVSGAPFTQCAPQIRERSRRGLIVDFHNSCSAIVPAASGPAAFPGGAAVVEIKGESLDMSYNAPPSPSTPLETLEIHATRTKK